MYVVTRRRCRVPGSRQAARRTDLYRRSVALLRDRAAATAATAWQVVDARDIDAGVEAALPRLVAAGTAYQAGAVRASNLYAALFVTDELGAPTRVYRADPEQYVGASRVQGAEISAGLASAGIAAKRLIALGQPADVAVRRAGAIAARNVAEEVMHAGRASLEEIVQQEDRITGYNRVVSGSACAACLALMDNVTRNEPLDVHDNCLCSAEPVVASVRQSIVRPTGEEVVAAMSPERMAQQFGAATADALGSGAINLTDLVGHSHMDAMADRITQAPLPAA